MSFFVEIDAVSKRYANHNALDAVSFNIPHESIFGLLGPNGAGKTSLIRIINQITGADEGEIRINGERLKPEHISMIGYLPEERGLYKKMKVIDQIIYFAQLKDLSIAEAKKRANEWLKRFDIEDWRNKKVEELSKGMQQKIQFITTIIHQPKLIILDEPFSGFDPINTELIKQEIKNLRNGGATVVFSTHRMESVEEICDHVGMINLSKKVLEGTVQEIKNQYKENKIAIEYSGTPQHNMPSPLSTEILPNGDTKAIFALTPEHRLMDLINVMAPQVHIKSFKELVPSMNEIFIKKVQEGAL
jgi:ABC-2 type transport system ATP-binding protein